MPSWVKEQDGIEWYDEWFTTRETNQSHGQLQKKVTAGKVRHHEDASGTHWYARPDVEELREAYLKRKTAAKRRKPSQKQLEARYAKQAEELRKRSRHFQGSVLVSHGDRVTLGSFKQPPKKSEDEEGDS